MWIMVAKIISITYLILGPAIDSIIRRYAESNVITVDHSEELEEFDDLQIYSHDLLAANSRPSEELEEFDDLQNLLAANSRPSEEQSHTASDSRPSEEPTFAQKINEYPIEDTTEGCPVCLEEDKKDIIKPFSCIHNICKDCFKDMHKAHEEGHNVSENVLVFGLNIELERKYDIPFKCPLCRADTKQV